MEKQITIITSHDENEEREERTLDWLRKHNATIEEWNGLQVLTMRAEIERGQYRDSYVVGFDKPDGNHEESYLYISLEPDPHDTVVYVEYEGSYSCECKGRGCVKCNGELEAIAAGRNPYLYHTLKVGDLVRYHGQEATIAGKVYENPGDYRLVCLVDIQGESGPATVVGVADIEPIEHRQPNEA